MVDENQTLCDIIDYKIEILILDTGSMYIDRRHEKVIKKKSINYN